MHEPTLSLNNIIVPSSNNSTLSIELQNIRRQILDDHIYPSIINNIQKNILLITRWESLNKILLIVKYICLAISPIITFTATTTDNYKIMNVISGVLASLGITFDRLSNMCLQQKAKCIKENEKTFKTLNIDINSNYICNNDDNSNSLKKEPSTYNI